MIIRKTYGPTFDPDQVFSHYEDDQPVFKPRKANQDEEIARREAILCEAFNVASRLKDDEIAQLRVELKETTQHMRRQREELANVTDAAQAVMDARNDEWIALGVKFDGLRYVLANLGKATS